MSRRILPNQYLLYVGTAHEVYQKLQELNVAVGRHGLKVEAAHTAEPKHTNQLEDVLSLLEEAIQVLKDTP